MHACNVLIIAKLVILIILNVNCAEADLLAVIVAINVV